MYSDRYGEGAARPGAMLDRMLNGDGPLSHALNVDNVLNAPGSEYFFFMPALTVDNANVLMSYVPRIYLIAKAFMLSIMRKR